MFDRLWPRLGFLFSLAATAWMGASPALAQSRLFSAEAPLQIVLDAPFRNLVRTAKTDPKPFPATLTVTDGAEAPQTIPIQVKPRGLTRRTAGYCDFPPIQLIFGEKATLKGTIFKGQRKLKLVTYCRDLNDYEQRVMLEYLAYKLYNVITPVSYRVRSAEVTYRKDDKDTGVTRFGYLIEDLAELADRNHSKALKLASHELRPAQFDAHAAGRAALFEYMIGNLDWDFIAGPVGADCCHNSRFIAAKDTPPLTGVAPIAYDFDYSGLIEAPYAGAPIGLPVESVTDRFYRGYCVSSPEMPAVVAEFRAHRSELMALINGQPGLTPKFRSRAARFMDDFFVILDDPAKVQTQIVKHCRQG